jgi:1-acyl-sn-glycerol-3-phosphate acyltransferase
LNAAPTLLERARAALWVLFGVVTVTPWGLTAVLISPFVSAERLYWFCIFWVRILLWGARVICGVTHRFEGAQHLRPGQPVVLLAKHQSALETLALCALMPQPLAFVFKRELLWIPFFGWALGRLDMIHIDRGRRAEAFAKVTEQGRRLAAQGSWVIMFPEGTRIERGQVGEYKLGGTRLACATGVPVQPVACATARVLPRKSLVLRAGEYRISVGPVMPSAGRSSNALMTEAKTWIEAEMRRLDPEAYRAPSGDAPDAVAA